MIVEEVGAGGRRCREHGISPETLSDLRSSLADHLSTVQGPCHEALAFPPRHPRDPRPVPRGRLCRSTTPRCRGLSHASVALYDLLVVNNSQPIALHVNKGNGTLKDMTLVAGSNPNILVKP